MSELLKSIPRLPLLSEASRAGINSSLIPQIIPVFPRRTKLEPSALPICPNPWKVSQVQTIRYDNASCRVYISSVRTNLLFQKPRHKHIPLLLLSIERLWGDFSKQFHVHLTFRKKKMSKTSRCSTVKENNVCGEMYRDHFLYWLSDYSFGDPLAHFRLPNRKYVLPTGWM